MQAGDEYNQVLTGVAAIRNDVMLFVVVDEVDVWRAPSDI